MQVQLKIAEFTPQPFEPGYILTNRHIQTIGGTLWRPKTNVSFRRERVNTPDGDFVDIDYADVAGNTWEHLGDTSPIVLVVHGLEGSAQRGYAFETYRQLARHGIRSVGMNFRSCSGEINSTAKLYHMGATDDLELVYDRLSSKFPHAPKGIIGFSLGANVTLKFTGEIGSRYSDSLKAVVAISPPFDLSIPSPIETTFVGRLYGRYFLQKLIKKAKAKTHQLRDLVDFEKTLAAQTIYEFDDACTAPLNGFQNARDYYRRTGAGQFIPHIMTPTLIIRALDDPFFTPGEIPHDKIAANPHILGIFPNHGGHVGFIQRHNKSLSFWAEQQAAQYFSVIFG